ncbi:lyase family protein, partial [Staphylococcus epidermidis]|uniref:lyase family protein n=1 Tax=Staphylococcus epidermidis TaxID=1282 RepID=UPI0037D9DC76
QLHPTLKPLPTRLIKIPNGITSLPSRPPPPLPHISIPQNQPPSSIIPPKVNPTQSQILTILPLQLIPNHTTLPIPTSQRNFQLNLFKPLIIHNTLQSIY